MKRGGYLCNLHAHTHLHRNQFLRDDWPLQPFDSSPRTPNSRSGPLPASRPGPLPAFAEGSILS